MATKREVTKLFNIKPTFLSKFSNNSDEKTGTHYIQKIKNFNNEIYNFNNVYLDGYWQTEIFFINVKEELLKEFTFSKPLTIKNQELLELATSQNSVSIHVRR